MSLRMMLSILRRHALMPALVMLQVMLACAILCNVLFMAWRRLEPMLAPSGVDQNNLILISGLSPIGPTWPAGVTRAGVATLREVPGVRAASAALGLPLGTSIFTPLALEGPAGVKVGVTTYSGKGLVDSLGLKLVAGRDFLGSEYFEPGQKSAGVTPIIITRSLASQLFSGGHAVGQLLHVPGKKRDGWTYRVVGVVAHLLRSSIGQATDGHADNTVLLPSQQTTMPYISYAVRVAPFARAATLDRVHKAVKNYFGPLMSPDTTVSVEYYNTLASSVFKNRREALSLFAGIVVIVLAVTVMGIMGLTGFWVQQRTKQVGIRRALGARRADILRDFMLENALIVGIAVILGMALAYGGHLLLMHYYELQALPLNYLPIGAAIMLVLGQLAVLAPALRAAAVPPVVATRSV